MRAMAELGPGPHRRGDIADLLGFRNRGRAHDGGKLILKGMAYGLSRR